MSSEIAKDLGTHLQKEIGAVVERHMKIARMACSPAEIAEILVSAAIGLSLSAAASAAATANSGEGCKLVAAGLLKAIAAAVDDPTTHERVLAAARAGKGDW